MDKRTKKTPSVDAALQKARKYCALRERSVSEVSKKLVEYGLMQGDITDTIEKLKAEGFINEQRFATTFASGKFRNKKWGRNRLKNEMRRKGLTDNLIQQGLAEVPEDTYLQTLEELLIKKWNQLKRKIVEDDYQSAQAARQKLMVYAVQKGYEHDAVMKKMGELKLFKA
jgi:regulatory protein